MIQNHGFFVFQTMTINTNSRIGVNMNGQSNYIVYRIIIQFPVIFRIFIQKLLE